MIMPQKAPRKRRESFKWKLRKLEAVFIRIPINPTTVTAALLLIQQVIELARVLKVPLQVQKVAPLDVQKEIVEP